MLLRHIRYLLAVAKHQNFTRAAEELHISQPTLSQQIRQLEESLRVQLFDRSGRTVRLTDAGEVYTSYARRALQDLDAGQRAIHDVQDLSRGLLRLAMTPTFTTYFIGPWVERFNALYPGITLNIKEMTQDQIEVSLAENQLDLGIAFSEVRSPDIDSEPLFIETLSLIVGQSHRLIGQQTSLTAKMLEHEGLALLSKDFATRNHIDLYFQKQGITPHIAIEANSVSAIVEIIRRGRLATLLPDVIAHEQTRLYSIAIQPTLPQRNAVLLWRRGAYRSAASQAFANLITHRFDVYQESDDF
ncbi:MULTISPECIES: transcriptional regulator CynR [unclassified Photorhabdus]|uniref:transcriptional regulator CynR n=1 Tax=unclassified Photorhabdus TaxID=2620880 RepID=UPI000DCBD7DA|nr:MULTISPECIES: transcriptional regulator CynR [unclassified Photorhabdus]RAW96534.1 transcriptional regulator CynR [Photorhabdus sp. S10-54]RAW96734.1 transcriptional regulator CynR [Photorhabdus sp. S9-53]RAX01041.1 transcriptional regulator CynR [Photorhabdus sp. S8-52]